MDAHESAQQRLSELAQVRRVVFSPKSRGRNFQDSGASKELALDEESGVSLLASEPSSRFLRLDFEVSAVLNSERLTFPWTLTLGPGAPFAAADVIELGPEVAVAVCDHGPVVEGEVEALLEGQVQSLQHK